MAILQGSNAAGAATSIGARRGSSSALAQLPVGDRDTQQLLAAIDLTLKRILGTLQIAFNIDSGDDLADLH